MFIIEREKHVSFLKIQWLNSIETIGYCRTEWLPVDGSPECLAHCHEWHFMERPLLSAKGESVCQWLEAVRWERIDRRRSQHAYNASRGPICEKAYWTSRIGEPIPYM